MTVGLVAAFGFPISTWLVGGLIWTVVGPFGVVAAGFASGLVGLEAVVFLAGVVAGLVVAGVAAGLVDAAGLAAGLAASGLAAGLVAGLVVLAAGLGVSFPLVFEVDLGFESVGLVSVCFFLSSSLSSSFLGAEGG